MEIQILWFCTLIPKWGDFKFASKFEKVTHVTFLEYGRGLSYFCQFGTDLNSFLPILSSHRMDHFDQRNKRLRENQMSCLGCTKVDPHHSQTEAVPSCGCKQYRFLLYLELQIILKSTRRTSVCLTPANLPFEGYSQYPNNRISI